MATHVTRIGKHRFVCGLFWQSLSRPRELKKEAASLAKKLDFDLMILQRDQTTAQAGFAHSRDGVRKMTYSLAAAVCKGLAAEGVHYDGRKQPVHDWLGAFKLPDGMWVYFAVRDGNFLPNGDFAGTKEQVLEHLYGDYGLGGWNAVVGDAELENYGFHNFNAKRIEDLIPHRKNGQLRIQKWWGMRPADARFEHLPAIASACMAGVVVIAGAYFWQQYQMKKDAEEQERALEAARQRMLSNTPAPVYPWDGQPAPLAAARACLEKFTLMSPGGWQLDEYVCSGNGALYTWSRNESTVEFLLDQVPGAAVDLAGQKASYSVPLKLAPRKAESLLDQKALMTPLLSRLQLLNLAPRFAPVQTPPSESGPHQGGQDAPQPNWQAYSFAVNASALPPTEIAALLNKPGIRLDKIAYRGGAWSLEGVIYAK